MYVLYSLWGSCEVKHLQAAAQKNTDILLFKHDVKFLQRLMKTPQIHGRISVFTAGIRSCSRCKGGK